MNMQTPMLHTRRGKLIWGWRGLLPHFLFPAALTRRQAFNPPQQFGGCNFSVEQCIGGVKRHRHLLRIPEQDDLRARIQPLKPFIEPRTVRCQHVEPGDHKIDQIVVGKYEHRLGCVCRGKDAIALGCKYNFEYRQFLLVVVDQENSLLRPHAWAIHSTRPRLKRVRNGRSHPLRTRFNINREIGFGDYERAPESYNGGCLSSMNLDRLSPPKQKQPFGERLFLFCCRAAGNRIRASSTPWTCATTTPQPA